MAWSKTERLEAVEELRTILKPNDEVYTIVTHVSRSGMSRRIRLFVVRDGENRSITHLVARAVGYRIVRGWADSIHVDGCGMDMCFDTVYQLGRTLFPEGGPTTRPRNGDKSGFESDGGYLLTKRDL